jgi:uncharacterized membrane protein
MATAWCIYTLVLVVCPAKTEPSPGLAWSGLGLSTLGFALLAAGAYSGAELVYDFGIGQTGKSKEA